MPTGVIALRAAAGSSDPAGNPADDAVRDHMLDHAAIVAAKLYGRFAASPAALAERARREAGGRDEAVAARAEELPPIDPGTAREAGEAYPAWVSALVLGFVAALVPLTILFGEDISPWIIPGLTLALLGSASPDACASMRFSSTARATASRSRSGSSPTWWRSWS